MGLFGGLMGWDAADERLPGSPQALKNAGIDLRIETVDAGDEHPNTYRLTLRNPRNEQHSLIAVSTGGGMVEVIDIDGFPLSLCGDYHETLLWVEGAARGLDCDGGRDGSVRRRYGEGTVGWRDDRRLHCHALDLCR
jgi:L-serine dehydratase